jgi:hypothetical protein
MKIFFSLPLFLLFTIYAYGNKLSVKEIKNEVSAINKILNNTYVKHEVQVPEKLDDALWARRIYLKAAGRIPTYDEITSFLADTSSERNVC